jgi:transcription termination/antitermination protein NusA
LKSLEGVDTDLLAKFAANKIQTRDDLAELAVDELVDMTGMDEQAAKALIMKAREHWFQ